MNDINTNDEQVREAHLGQTRDRIAFNCMVRPMWEDKMPPSCIACDVDGETWIWFHPSQFSCFCKNQPLHGKVLTNPRTSYKIHSFYYQAFCYIVGRDSEIDVEKWENMGAHYSRPFHRSNHLFQ